MGPLQDAAQPEPGRCEKERCRRFRYWGAVSLKLLGGKLALKLVYFVLRKELLNFSEMAP